MSIPPPSAPVRRLPPSTPLLVLGIASIVLLLTTIALGGLTAWLLLTRGSAGPPVSSPSPDASQTTPGEAQLVQGIEITTSVDPALDLGSFAMSAPDEGGFVAIVAPVTWTNTTDAVSAYFDVTAYDAAGDIINRNPSSFYALPGQETFFVGIFSADLSDAVRITVEQTKADVEPPIMTGGITVEVTESGESSFLGARMATGLSAVPEYPKVYLVGYVDGEMFGYCYDYADIPASGTFISTCKVIAVSADGDPWFDGEFPEDAEYRVFLELSIPN